MRGLDPGWRVASTHGGSCLCGGFPRCGSGGSVTTMSPFAGLLVRRGGTYILRVDPIGGARLMTVNIVAELHADRGRSVRQTAIDKRPVDGPAEVGPLGVSGDLQVNRKHHGGPDKAIYAFAREDVAQWEAELRRSITPGGFGENFTTTGLDVSGALVGERWRVGGGPGAVLVEVSMPRTPCATFARWMGEQNRGWVKRFTAYGRVGAYLRVLRSGTVAAGDAIAVEHRPAHGVTAADVLRGLTDDQARALLAAAAAGDIRLAREIREQAERIAARGGA